MNDATQPSKRSAVKPGQVQDPPKGGYGNGHGNGDGRPQQDPILTQRFLALDDALNGPAGVIRSQKLNWSGVNEVTAAFDSIADALEAAFPVDRPTSDLPPKSGGKQTGS
jgi:hypothetical protein